MTRILAILLALTLVYIGIRSLFRRALRSPAGKTALGVWQLFQSQGAQPKRPGQASTPSAAGGALVRCSGCGTHVPPERARRIAEELVCERCAAPS